MGGGGEFLWETTIVPHPPTRAEWANWGGLCIVSCVEQLPALNSFLC